jgi:hypothetical protein
MANLLLGVSMVAVALYCLARAFVPALRPVDHRRDVDVWHGVMAGAMAVMLLAGHGRPLAALGLLVFGAGLAWSGLRAVRRTGRAAYVRLGVGCAAMAVMLVPSATLAPADAAVSSGAGDAHAMHHHHHAATAATSGAEPLALPAPLVVLLLAVVAALVLARLPAVVRRGAPVETRLDAVCEALMGVAMAAMLAVLV